ncbi:MAG: DDE-type integrase/transposase/recombinase [Alphaproteobacteria bacterium]
MRDEKEFQMAMFKYEVIVPLLHNSEKNLQSRMHKLSEKFWTLPDGRLRVYAWGTIEDWYYIYKQGGLDALMPRERNDKGSFKSLDEEICSCIDKTISEHPELKSSIIIERLTVQGFIKNGRPSASSIYRYIRSVKPQLSAPSQERRSFEAPHAGSLWQTDIMYGPYLPRKDSRGRWCKKQTYLIGIIDDNSRLLCHGEFFFEQDLLAYLSCLKTALNKRGIPERLYCDNGQVFLSRQVKRIMAKLGTGVIHTKIRDAAAKGKIERFFKTVRGSFLEPLLAFEKPKTLKELNNKFFIWSEDSYNHKKHSTTGMKPIDRWLKTSHKVKLLSLEMQDEMFRFTETRKVKKDGTFSLKNKIYETNYVLSGRKVSVNYDPFMSENIYVSLDGENYGKATPLNRNFNAGMPRKNTQNKEKKC